MCGSKTFHQDPTLDPPMRVLNDLVRVVVSYVILVYCKISSKPAESYATEEVTTVSNLESKVLNKLNNQSEWDARSFVV